MSIVRELLRSVETEHALNVLRKARRVASVLGVTDINQWLQHELEGYNEGVVVPKYRVVACQLVYTNGPLPLGNGSVSDYPSIPSQDRVWRQSLREVLAMIDDSSAEHKQLHPPLDRQELINALSSSTVTPLTTQVTFMVRANVVQVRAIPEAVKDRIYDWAVALERTGVAGDAMAFFTEAEKAIARTIIFNLHNCQIEQLNNEGCNVRKP